MSVKGAFKVVLAAIGAAMLSQGALATPLETINVSTATGAGVSTQTVLEAGVTYRVTVTGVANIGRTAAGAFVLADADFYSIDNFASFVDVNPNQNVDLGLALNGVVQNFGPFNLQHVYTTLFVGLGQVLNLSFIDTFYGDNDAFGALTVALERVDFENPIPGAAILFGPTIAAAFGLSRRKKAARA